MFMYNLFLLFGLFFLTSCKEPTNDSQAIEKPKLAFETCDQLIGSHPCDFSLINQHGEVVELYSFYEKIVIIDFSVMWCGPCLSMGLASEAIVNDYGKENVEWLTLIIESEQGLPPEQDDLLRWAQATGITGHVLASDRSIIDASATVGYPISGWPTYVVIDAEMVLRYGSTGWNESVLRSTLDSIINEG